MKIWTITQFTKIYVMHIFSQILWIKSDDTVGIVPRVIWIVIECQNPGGMLIICIYYLSLSEVWVHVMRGIHDMTVIPYVKHVSVELNVLLAHSLTFWKIMGNHDCERAMNFIEGHWIETAVFIAWFLCWRALAQCCHYTVFLVLFLSYIPFLAIQWIRFFN